MIQLDPAIPFYTLESLEDYVIDGDIPGGFLTAALKNDLSRTFSRADGNNRPAIGTLHAFLYNYAPARSWGSCDEMEAWLAKGGLRHTAPDAIDKVRARFEKYRALNYETA
jgi:hypothetical protein